MIKHKPRVVRKYQVEHLPKRKRYYQQPGESFEDALCNGIAQGCNHFTMQPFPIYVNGKALTDIDVTVTVERI